jgi:hypothetical protein
MLFRPYGSDADLVLYIASPGNGMVVSGIQCEIHQVAEVARKISIVLVTGFAIGRFLHCVLRISPEIVIPKRARLHGPRAFRSVFEI